MLSLQSLSLHSTIQTYVCMLAHPSTHLQYCSVLQCHHEEVEPSHHTPTHGRNVTARHLHQLRTCYYLTTWLRVISGTIGILRAVEMGHEHALAHNTLVHYCTYTICTLHTVTLIESVHSQPFQTPSSALSTCAYR